MFGQEESASGSKIGFGRVGYIRFILMTYQRSVIYRQVPPPLASFRKTRLAGSLVAEKCRLCRTSRLMSFRCQIRRRRVVEFHAPWANRLLPGNVLSKKLIGQISAGIMFGSLPPEILAHLCYRAIAVAGSGFFTDAYDFFSISLGRLLIHSD